MVAIGCTPRAISQHFNIAKPSVSDWLAPLIDEDVLAWCDVQGAEFAHIRDLEKAKRSGKAYVRLSNRIGLPTPFELTGDPSWAEGGT